VIYLCVLDFLLFNGAYLDLAVDDDDDEPDIIFQYAFPRRILNKRI
jgi:hypothetical protein